MLKKILMIGMSFAIMTGAFAETAAPTVNQDKEKKKGYVLLHKVSILITNKRKIALCF